MKVTQRIDRTRPFTGSILRGPDAEVDKRGEEYG